MRAILNKCEFTVVLPWTACGSILLVKKSCWRFVNSSLKYPREAHTVIKMRCSGWFEDPQHFPEPHSQMSILSRAESSLLRNKKSKLTQSITRWRNCIVRSPALFCLPYLCYVNMAQQNPSRVPEPPQVLTRPLDRAIVEIQHVRQDASQSHIIDRPTSAISFVIPISNISVKTNTLSQPHVHRSPVKHTISI